jgi:putative ABC transport system permease protein
MAIPLKVNIRSLVVRRTASLLTIGGIGLIIMALTVVWGLEQGLLHVLAVGGDPNNLLVLRGGSTTETTSGILDENVRVIELSEGIDVGPGGQPLVSGEMVVIVNQSRRDAPRAAEGESSWAGGANIMIRGVGPAGVALRPGMEIVAGRMFEPGKNEAIAARSMAGRFADCGLGETLMLRRVPYTITGLFTAEGSPYESEIWTDLNDLGTTFSRTGAVSGVLLRVSDPLARERIRTTLEADPRLNVDVVSQTDYFARQTRSAGGLIALGSLMTFFLSIGACFSAANTMYASVLSRSREIGTLRALGFSRPSILLAYLVESLVVSLAAGILGLILGAGVLAVAGTAGTGNVTFTEITFSMRITPVVVIICMATCAVIGMLGGLLPAMRAARMKVVDALRA